VLIIDDSPDLRALLRRLLHLEGYAVLEAENGQAGLQLLSSGTAPQPGMILLDLMMPVMDGHQFLARLSNVEKLALREIPIVVISAENQKVTGNIVGYLQKPIDPDRLLSFAEQHCRCKV
jgi:two-component system, chemotaxis family, chemotaxis protein CheY